MYRKYLFFSMLITLIIASCGQAASSPTSPLPEVTSAPPTSLTHTGEPLVSNEWASTSIQWTQGEAEDKLFLDSGGNVDTEVVSVGSPPVEAQRTGNCQAIPSPDGNTEGDCAMQFRIDDSVLFAGSPTTLVRIEVEYFDQGTDSFFIQYDAGPGAPFGDGIINETALFSKTDSGSFKTAVFTLEDAYFANRNNGGDFRIDGMDDGAEIIRSLKITLLIDPTRAADTADIIFYNGNVITMEEDMPQAEAIAVKDEIILAVGSDEDILAFQGPATQMIDLDGLTIIPGFVDTHTHLLGGGGGDRRGIYKEEAQQILLEDGTTAIGLMIGRPESLELLIEFEEQGELRIRTTMYLGYISNCGELVGDWVKEYPIDRDPSHMLRFGGIKLFSDGGSCMRPAFSFDLPDWAIKGGKQGDLFWSEEDLTAMVRELQAEGFQVGIHAIGDRGVETVLNAYENALGGGPNIYRHRIEHNSAVRPEFLPRYSEIGAIPIMVGGSPACQLDNYDLIYMALFDLYPETYRDWFNPIRKLLDANPDLPNAWHTDRPALDNFPIGDLFGFVTKKGYDPKDGSVCDPPDWLAAKAITVEEALRIMTINGAYALFMEEKIGSLKPGKYADLVILSEDPLTIDPIDLINLEVRMTMVGGKVAHCAPGYEALCPSHVDTPPPTSSPTPSPSGVQLISQSECGEDQTCYDVTVTCQGLPLREVTIMASHLADSKGAVVFIGGGFTNRLFGGGIIGLHTDGYETYMLAYQGELGYFTDSVGSGLKNVACSTSEVIKWIVSELADNPGALGAIGVSAGSMQLGYGLAVYGLGDILDVVVLDSGPVHADMVNACFAFSTPARGRILDYAHDWFGNGDYCQNGSGPEWLIPILEADSIVSSSPGEVRDYHYPNTKVVFIEGQKDAAAVALGRVFYDAITSEKTWIVLPDLGHGVVNKPEGKAAIREELLKGLNGK